MKQSAEALAEVQGFNPCFSGCRSAMAVRRVGEPVVKLFQSLF